MNTLPEPQLPESFDFPQDTAVRTNAEWKDLVWKWLGVPDELWPMMELMGVIFHRASGTVLTVPRRGEFIIVVPYPSCPSSSVMWALGDECHTLGVDGWRELLRVMLDAMGDTR